MRATPNEAVVLIKSWPTEAPLSGTQTLTLLRQLTELELPESDLRQWKKESSQKDLQGD